MKTQGGNPYGAKFKGIVDEQEPCVPGYFYIDCFVLRRCGQRTDFGAWYAAVL
jgi:hypothetical protein